MDKGQSKGKRRAGRLLPLTFCLSLFALWSTAASAQQVHRNSFEARQTGWLKGTADAPFQEAVHDLTDQTAHTGQASEHIQLTAERGTAIWYYYPVGRAPVAEELGISVWFKANRPGIQLAARVVLPKERNPNNLDEPVSTLVRGDLYQLVGRWQRMELRRPAKLAREQQQLMRAELGRDVDFTDAYIDRLMVNLYAGPGLTEAWIDDVEVGPILEAPSPFQPTGRPAEQPGALPAVTRPGAPDTVSPPSRAAVVELTRDHLLVSGKRFFIRGIRHSDTPLRVLRDAGFNCVWFDHAAPPEQMEEAIQLGFWLVPSLPVTAHDAPLNNPESLSQTVARFRDADAVLFWDLGGGLAAEQNAQVSQVIQVIRAADPQRPIGADIWDGFLPYSRHLDLVGVHRWPLMTSLELTKYRAWLTQRRNLARPGTYLWTWVQTHLPEWHLAQVYDRPPGSTGGFDEPVGPLPEQIRLLAYTALCSGCRGLGFWSDRFLADSHQGRDRLLGLALLNQELQMLEPILLAATEPPDWIDTSLSEVKAAVIRTERGILVVPVWLGKGSQYVPGQAASNKLAITVPQVPVAAQAWEVTPGDVRSVPIERVVGGTKVTVPEFGLTSAVLFTSDNSPTGLLVRLQDYARRTRKLAAQWAHDLAQAEVEKVLRVEAQLEQAGHTLPDGQALKDNVQGRLRACVEHWERGDYRQAYQEAQRVLRPLRIMMRAQWELAVKDLDVPAASPYAVSFFTLPRHWQFLEQLRQTQLGANLLPDGNFEQSLDQAPAGWTRQEAALDDVELVAKRVAGDAREGKQCLVLHIKPKAPANLPPNQEPLPPNALERTYLAITSPAVKLAPGTLVRVSGWLRVPKTIAASVDGALLFDSAGGEPLAVRLTEATGWKQFSLYRRVPASGQVALTVALTGIGSAFFDDLRIEPLVPGTSANPTVASPGAPR